MLLTLHFDGSCWPNPGGLAKYGYTLRDGGRIDVAYGLVGDNEHMSNNHAELFAMSEGLEHCLRVRRFHLHNLNTVLVKGDSEVALRLMTGRYRANRQKLYYPQYIRAKIAQEQLADLGVRCDFMWVPRAQNQEADDLSKLPISVADPGLVAEAEELLCCPYDNVPWDSCDHD